MTDYYYVDYFDEKTMKQKFINIVKEQAGKDQFIEKDFLSIATDPSKLSYRVVLNGVLTFYADVKLSVAWHAVKHELFEKADRWGGTESGSYKSQVYLIDRGLKGSYESYSHGGTFYTDKYTREQLAYATNVPEILGFSQSMEKAILANTYSFEKQAMTGVYSRYSGYSITTEKPYASLDGVPSLFGAQRYISPTYEISFMYKNKKFSAWFNEEGQMINKIDYPIEQAEMERRKAEEEQKRIAAEKFRKEEKAKDRAMAPMVLIALYTVIPLITILIRFGFEAGIFVAVIGIIGGAISLCLPHKMYNEWAGIILGTVIMLIVSAGVSILAFSSVLEMIM